VTCEQLDGFAEVATAAPVATTNEPAIKAPPTTLTTASRRFFMLCMISPS
jgi:hypothetical protein